MVMSRLTTSATLRSRNDFEARVTAAAAAFSHDSVLVPTSSITLYTLSAMVGYLRSTPYRIPGRDHRAPVATAGAAIRGTTAAARWSRHSDQPRPTSATPVGRAAGQTDNYGKRVTQREKLEG